VLCDPDCGTLFELFTFPIGEESREPGRISIPTFFQSFWSTKAEVFDLFDFHEFVDAVVSDPIASNSFGCGC